MHKRTRNRVLALLIGAIVVGPRVAQAEGELTASLQALEARMLALEDKLAASEATVAAQRELLGARAAPAPGALDSFLQDLELGGFVEASYIYNLSNPDRNLTTQDHLQFNVDHNTFTLNGVKLEIGKSADEPGEAGFQIDLLYGDNASLLNAGLPLNQGLGRMPLLAEIDHQLGPVGLISEREAADDAFFTQEAYVSYNASGVELKMGKFETLLGYEVIDAPYNPNITHSELFWAAIPLFHTGILASGNLQEGFNWAVGVVNGWNNSNDFNDNKGVLGRLGYAEESFSVTFNAFIGSEGLRASATKGLPCSLIAPLAAGSGVGDCFGDNNNRTAVYDLVATFTPTDAIDTWAEVVYGYQELDSGIVGLPVLGGLAPAGTGTEDPEWLAVVAGAVYALSERTKVALRGEYFHDDGNYRLGHAALFGNDSDHYAGTVTLHHNLTDNLLARLEYRHDVVDVEGGGGVDNVFRKHDAEFDDQQDIGIVEVSYIFD